MGQPIVIIGAARSGTKFLRDTLAASRITKAVPYDVNYVWRYGQEAAPDDCLHPDALTPKAATFIPKTLRRLAKIAPTDTSTVLIEKTVSNTLRVDYVAKVLPNARFIHLTRDGRDVAQSAQRQWQAPPDWAALRRKLRDLPLSNLPYCLWFLKNMTKRDGLWGPRYPGIHKDVAQKPLAEVCAEQWRQSVTQSMRVFTESSSLQVYHISYEALIADGSALGDLCAWLALPDVDVVLDQYRKTLAPSVPANKRKTGDQPQQKALNADLEPLLRQLGYA